MRSPCSLPQAEQTQLSQPVLTGEVVQSSDGFCVPPLDLLQQFHILPVLRAPEQGAAFQVGSHQSGVEGQNHLPRPAGHAAFDAVCSTQKYPVFQKDLSCFHLNFSLENFGGIEGMFLSHMNLC